MTEPASNNRTELPPAEVTWWPSLTDVHGRSETTTWPDLFRYLGRIRPFEGDRHPGWSAAIFGDDKRELSTVQRVTAAVLDYDDTATIERALESWKGTYGFLHTTKAHTEDNHRFRVVLPLSRPVSAFEWRALWARLDRHANGCLDPKAKDASRFWYSPGVLEGHPFTAHELNGDLLDVDAWLSRPEPNSSPPVAPTPLRDPSATEKRAVAYISRMPEAIAGSGGHNATWQVAVTLARGFGLDESATLRILQTEYNRRCQPEWTEKELRHKAKQAQNARVPYGYLLNDQRDWSPERAPKIPYEPPPPEIDEMDPYDVPEDPEASPSQERKPLVVLSMREMFDAVVERAKTGVPEVGVSTCHYLLDHLMGGFRKRRITVLGARTSFGKSSYAIMVLDEALRSGKRCVLVSGEDTEETFGQRFMARRARVNAARLRVNRCDEKEIQRMESHARGAETSPFFINAIGRPIEETCEKLRAISEDGELDLVVFDYLQCFQTRRRSQDRRNEITYIAQHIGSTVKEIGASGLALSQLKRPDGHNPKKPPTMHDLKESGDVENQAEHVILGHIDEEPAGKFRKIGVAKNKDGPMPGDGDDWLTIPFDQTTASFKVVHGSVESYDEPDPWADVADNEEWYR